MATYTSNLNLKKPALDDDALITDINNNMDILDAAANGIEDALAIVANGNTHAAITSGQFVYVRNHNTLTEGLYVASSNIAANATLSSSNLTADSKGGLNALSEQIAHIDKWLGNVSDLNISNSSFTTYTTYNFTFNSLTQNKPSAYQSDASGHGYIKVGANINYFVMIVYADQGICARNYRNGTWGTWKNIYDQS